MVKPLQEGSRSFVGRAVALHGMLVTVGRLHVRVNVVHRPVECIHFWRLAIRELDGVQIALGTRHILRGSDEVVTSLGGHGVARLQVAAMQKWWIRRKLHPESMKGIHTPSERGPNHSSASQRTPSD